VPAGAARPQTSTRSGGGRGLPDVGDHAVGDLEHPPRGGQEPPAGRGQRDPAAVALEQAAEPGLEPGDAL